MKVYDAYFQRIYFRVYLKPCVGDHCAADDRGHPRQWVDGCAERHRNLRGDASDGPEGCRGDGGDRQFSRCVYYDKNQQHRGDDDL